MLAQQCDSLVAPPLQLQHNRTEHLNCSIIRARLNKLFNGLDCSLNVPRGVLGEGLDCLQVGLAGTLYLGEDSIGFALCDSCAVGEDFGGDLVFGRERGGALAGDR